MKNAILRSFSSSRRDPCRDPRVPLLVLLPKRKNPPKDHRRPQAQCSPAGPMTVQSHRLPLSVSRHCLCLICNLASPSRPVKYPSLMARKSILPHLRVLTGAQKDCVRSPFAIPRATPAALLRSRSQVQTRDKCLPFPYPKG